LQEETGIVVPSTSLENKGLLRFAFEEKPEWDQEVHVFVTRDYRGPDAVETEEMAPKWFKIDDIPYDSMWVDDPYWLPSVIRGENVDFSFVFDGDGDLAEVVEGFAF
jgi:8-oxo-dGTP diphosphatase